MNKVLFYCGLFIASHAFATDVLDANRSAEELVNASGIAEDKSCHRHRSHPRCPTGPAGVTGPTGPAAPGPTGPAGPIGGLSFEVNDVIEATLHADELVLSANELVPFISPIVNPTNGVNVPGGMELVESVPASGNFDTITLPIETAATLYLVSFGVSATFEGEFSSSAQFQLVLNGINQTYTNLTLDIQSSLFSNTTIISNPANTAGTLSLISLVDGTVITDPSEIGLSAYISIIKLNNNSP